MLDNPASLPFGQTILDRPPAPCGAYKFPEATSLSTCFSSDRSATTLEPDVLSLKLFHPLRLINFKATVFLAPPVIAARFLPRGKQQALPCPATSKLQSDEAERQSAPRSIVSSASKAPLPSLSSHIAWSKKARSGHYSLGDLACGIDLILSPSQAPSLSLF
jgi:hypothetical protein